MSEMTRAGTAPIVVALFNATGDVGGGERFMLDLADGLDPLRYRVRHLCPWDGPFAQILRKRGWPVDVVNLTSLLAPQAVLRLRTLLRAANVQILHTAGARANVYGRVAAALARVPVVVSTVHTSIYGYEVSTLRRMLYLWADKATAPLADQVLVTSEAMQREVLSRYGFPADRVTLVRNGLNAPSADAGASGGNIRASLGIARDQPVIGCVGRMAEQKGQIHLLHALPELVKAFPDLRCLWVGDGPLRGMLEAEAKRLGLTPFCLFTGVRADLNALYGAMDVVVMPSIVEGIPYVLLEAMAAGRAIVATRVGGIPEVIEEGRSGRLVAPASPPHLAAAIDDLLRNPGAARRLGEGARARVQLFSRADMVNAIDALYRRLLRARGMAA